jgi:hypothetical protein
MTVEKRPEEQAEESRVKERPPESLLVYYAPDGTIEPFDLEAELEALAKSSIKDDDADFGFDDPEDFPARPPRP